MGLGVGHASSPDRCDRVPAASSAWILLQPVQQAVAVGDLDREPGPRVEFQDQRALVLVEHDVDADVAQPGQLVGSAPRSAAARPSAGSVSPTIECSVSGCSLTGSLPQTPRRVMPVGMSMPTPIAPWCRLALPSDRRVGRRIMRHHRIAQEHDDADVRHALVADVVEDRVELHAVLDQHVVGLAAEARTGPTACSTGGGRTPRAS